MINDQTVFINGACGLIGSEFVSACLENGASVVAADISKDRLANLASEHSSTRLQTIAVDLTSADSVENSLNLAVEQFGKVTALVNAAYPRNANYGREFFDVEYGDFSENLTLNVATTFQACKTFGRYFKEQGQGNIINLGSIYGVVAPDFDIYPEGMTMPVEYAAIKSAIIHLTKYMAQLMKKDGVRVNCISPGGILDSQPEYFLEKYNKKCGRLGMLNSEHLNSTLLYLLSEASSAVTGQNIVVDDGFTL